MNSIELEAQMAGELRDREGLSTREIAERTGMPQSTVVRRLKLHDTGPQQVLRKRARNNPLPLALLVFAVLMLLAAAGAFAFLRSPRTVTVIPASVCVRSAKTTITGLADPRNGACPHGWSLLVLTPRH